MIFTFTCDAVSCVTGLARAIEGVFRVSTIGVTVTVVQTCLAFVNQDLCDANTKRVHQAEHVKCCFNNLYFSYDINFILNTIDAFNVA